MVKTLADRMQDCLDNMFEDIIITYTMGEDILTEINNIIDGANAYYLKRSYLPVGCNDILDRCIKALSEEEDKSVFVARLLDIILEYSTNIDNTEDYFYDMLEDNLDIVNEVWDYFHDNDIIEDLLVKINDAKY